MVEVSKQEMEWLIKNGYLKCKNGQYPDLAITSKHKKGKRKRRYVSEPVAEKLKLMSE